VAQQLQASVFYLLRVGASKSGLSSFGVGHVTVSVKGYRVLKSYIEFDLVDSTQYSPKTSSKLGLLIYSLTIGQLIYILFTTLLLNYY